MEDARKVAVKGAGRTQKPHFGKALVLGGLLLFGTLFGGGMLALRSGSLWPGEYNQGAFVFTNGYLTGGANHIVVVTADRQNDPIPNGEVVISFSNSTGFHRLLDARTDSRGILSTDIILPAQPGKGDAPPQVTLVVQAAGELISKTLTVYGQSSYQGPFATVSPSSGSGEGSGSGSQPEPDLPVKLYLTLDKPRYQPGQTVHLRTLCFREGGAVTENVTYEVSDPNGNKLFRKAVAANRFGVTFLDYPISDILPLGEYRLSANTTSALVFKSVPVERYVLPRFSIGFGELKGFYTLDDEINARLDVNYFFGKPVEGQARITARLSQPSFGWYYSSSKTEVELLNTTVEVRGGKGPFTVPGARSAAGTSYNDRWAQYSLELTAEVTDTAGHAEKKTASISISPQRFYFTYISETPTPGQICALTVVVRDPVGTPLKGMGAALKNGTVQLASASTDERGLARLPFTYDFQQSLTLTVKGGSPSYEDSSGVWLGGPSAIKLVPDKRFYEVGETAHVTVLADPRDDFSGVSGIALASVVGNGRQFVTRELDLEDASGSFSFQVTRGMLPALELEVSKLSVMSYNSYYQVWRYEGLARPDDTYSDRYTMAQDRLSVGVGMQSELALSVTASKGSLEPGEEVELLFKTMNGTTPVSAALAVAIVDEALLAMGGLSAFDEIRQDLARDPGYQQYTIYSYIWGPAVKRAAPMFSASVFYDFGPSGGMLQYSSMNKVGDRVMAGPDAGSISRYSLGLALVGILGYFGIIMLGIKYRRTAVAMIAGSLLLVAVVPVAQDFSTGPKPGEYRDYSRPLGFTQYTSEQNRYFGEAMDKSWRDTGVAPSLGPQPQGGGSKGGAGEGASGGAGSMVAPTRAVTVRSSFPELWYWNPMVVTDESGQAVVRLNAPDSITTWRIDTLASTADGRIGVGNGSLVVFQPFFVDPDLPVSVVRNDRFTFKVAIYNYETSGKTVAVRLRPSDWFQTIGTDTVSADVGANSVTSVQFTLKATKVGVQPVTVSGATGGLQDVVTRTVRVEPDGALFEDIQNGLLVNTTSSALSFELKGSRIPGSENAYLKLQSSIESVIMDGAEGFINVVSGCGEQSTSGLSVDILAYQNYIKGKTDKTNLTRHQDIITRGIQHEALYLSSDTGGHGRAIVWHFGEKPDIWLTAWAIQAYKNLRDAGFGFDDRVIPDLQTYLLSAQAAEGSWDFPDAGHWSINSELESSRTAATAYIVRALLISGLSPANTAVLTGVAYLEKNAAGVKETFTQALCLDALELAQGSSGVRAPLAQKLVFAARDGGNGARYWGYGDAEVPERNCYRGDNTVETTGYAMMALARAGAGIELVPAGAKYLVLARGAGGFYGSTHNTAVAFTALNSLSELTPLKNMRIDVLVDGEPADTVTVDQENKDLTFLTDLGPWFVSQEGAVAPRTVSVTLRSSGEGGVFYHLYTKQNLEWARVSLQPAPELGFTMGYSSTDVRVGQVISAVANVSYTGAASGVQMVLVDLWAPTGFVLDENDLIDLQRAGKVNFYEFRGSGRALIYLDSLKRNETRTLEYTLTAMMPAASLLQHVNAFDMYNTDLRVELPPVSFTSVQ